MAQHCRRIATLAPWKRLIIQQSRATPVRNFWSSRHPSDFRSLFRDVDRTIGRLEREFIDNFPFRLPRLIPIQGIQQHGEVFRMNVDVDGFKPEEIKLSLKDNILTIHAKMDRAAEDGSKYHQEFTREVTLPENVDLTELKSFLDNNGILKLEAAYKPTREEKPKEIPVNRE